ncbi:MAG: sugar ABC transporter substrate-binding protein [Chromatocurvus sp.]
MQDAQRSRRARSAWLVIAALLMVGCAEQAPESSTAGAEAEADDTPRVALIMKSLANEFFISMADGARAHQTANAERYSLVVNGIRNESDLAQQVALMEQMMATGVDVIVIAPADSKALLPVVRRAARQGIVVVNIDNKFDRQLLAEMDIAIPFVGPDNRDGARRVGQRLAAELNPGDEVAIIGGIPGAFNARERAAGFRDAMQAADVSIVSTQAADWEQSKAANIASALLREYPDLDALLCANDSMALGAVAAVRQAGRSDEVLIVGFDNIGAANALVERGELVATADQHADRLAVYGIEYALEILQTGQMPTDRTTPVDVVSAGG